MARFGDNPLMDPVTPALIMPGTNTDTDEDVSVTVQVLADGIAPLLPLATGSTQGVVTGPDGDKLAALYSKAQLDALFAQLAQTLLPIFFGTASDGSLELLVNNTDNDIVIQVANFACSSGSVTAALTIDGTPITGLSALNISSTPGSATASALNTLAPGSVLGVTFTGSTGSPGPENVRITLKGLLSLV